MIIEARKKGPFKDLNDFIRRVDLHKVGKRSLECLIKVGALDCLVRARHCWKRWTRMVSDQRQPFPRRRMRPVEHFWPGRRGG